MSNNHTPGPWHVQGCGIVSMNDNIAHVARLPGEENHPSVLAERKANAALIASAPELLAALSQLLIEVDDMTARVGWSGNGGRKMARAAIAKATGVQS